VATDKISTKQMMQAMSSRCPRHIAGILESQLSGLIDNHYQTNLPENVICELNRELLGYLTKFVEATARHAAEQREAAAQFTFPQNNLTRRKSG
jgi:hypothetical protein